MKFVYGWIPLENLNQKDKSTLKEILKKEKIVASDINEAIALINKTNGQEEADKLKDQFIKKAKKNLMELPESKARELLMALSDFVINREK